LKNHPEIEKAACVILDINLPDGSGIDLRQDLKAASVSVPVIFITGNAILKAREAAVASGCVAFLTKPFSSRELIEPLKMDILRGELSTCVVHRAMRHCTFGQ
jgi:FixJ family two-component response regulator